MLNNELVKTPLRVLVYLFISLYVLVGCSTTGGNTGAVQTGPQPSSAYNETEAETYQGVKPDVVIPVFSAGLSDSEANYEEEGIWPELRRAEANRFAYQLKQALDDTGMFGAVRVTPNAEASGDL